jgi:hypothetical protein
LLIFKPESIVESEFDPFLGELRMSLVYISLGRIGGEVEENLEFAGATWMDALDTAYVWLKTNRKMDYFYHVWC